MIISDNGFVIYYFTGNFDNYCVYVLRPTSKGLIKWTPKDKEYFKWLRWQGEKHTNDKVFNDFLKLYNIIEKDTSFVDVIKVTRELNNIYGVQYHHWWIILALTMIAEENRENTVLGKRIKLLGVYNVLKDNWKISYVDKYMRNRKAYEIEEWLEERGL